MSELLGGPQAGSSETILLPEHMMFDVHEFLETLDFRCAGADGTASRKYGWGLAYWFASANSLLGGKRPQDVLATSPDRVLAAAADEMAGIAHG